MGQALLNGVIDHLRRAAVRGDTAPLTDRQLPERFIAGRDEVAYEALVRRHAPLVLGVCRRVLRNCHDAEDAFQATFLVLARKAASVTSRDTLGAWLYGVAYRIAVRAKVMTARRRDREIRAGYQARAEAVIAPSDSDFERLLDEELNRLPARYRVPVVLCELQGKSRKDAARLLGVPEGTLSSRLARARDFLRRRLTARGLPVTGAALSAALTRSAASAVPQALVGTTLRAVTAYSAGAATGVLSANVLALTQSGLKAALVYKLQVGAAAVFGACALWAGVGSVTAIVSASDAPPPIVAVANPVPSPPRPIRSEPLPAMPETETDGPTGDYDMSSPPAEPDDEVGPPPERLHRDPFYKKYVNAGGLPILSSEKVSDRALREAAYLVKNVLATRPDVRDELCRGSVYFVVMHQTDRTTDLPEQHDLRPKESWDRLRGLGDRVRNCGEENLLRKKTDPHAGKSVLIHQLAYAMYADGLSAVEPDFKPRLAHLYQTAVARGLWKGTRALASRADYWSEAVLAYFDAARPRPRGHGASSLVPTREALKAHDPELFQLVDGLFHAPNWRYVPPGKRK